MTADVGEFEAFRAVRREQAAILLSAMPAYQAFVQGCCHALAYAVQDRMGGDLIVITPRDQPNSMVHVGVLKDGVVTDADGHSQSGYWGESWGMKAAPDAMIRYTTREEIETSIKPYDVSTPTVLAAAVPMAEALVAARHVDTNAWRSFLPVGALRHIGPDPRREDRVAYDTAISKGDTYCFPPAIILPARMSHAARAASMHAVAGRVVA